MGFHPGINSPNSPQLPLSRNDIGGRRAPERHLCQWRWECRWGFWWVYFGDSIYGFVYGFKVKKRVYSWIFLGYIVGIYLFLSPRYSHCIWDDILYRAFNQQMMLAAFSMRHAPTLCCCVLKLTNALAVKASGFQYECMYRCIYVYMYICIRRLRFNSKLCWTKQKMIHVVSFCHWKN